MRRASSELGFARLNLSTHSLRRGGATELLRQGFAFNDIVLFGRWSSEASAKLYLRQGEVALTRTLHDFPAEVWSRVQRIASLHEVCWCSVEDKGKVASY